MENTGKIRTRTEARADRVAFVLVVLLAAAGCGEDESPAGPDAPGGEPTACFSIAPNPGDAGTSFLFDARCSAGDTDSTLAFRWDFDGDGAFETSLGSLGFTQRVYADVGTYAVALEVRDSADGLADTTSATLEVTPPSLPPGLTRLTSDSFVDGSPAWSFDGDAIAFHSNRSGNLDLWVVDFAGRAEPEQLTTAPEADSQPAWSFDGTRIAFQSTREDPSGDIWILDVATGDATRLTIDKGVEEYPTWSPDGLWVAYSSDGGGTGTRDIWKIPAAGGSAVQVTSESTFEADPAWSPNGGAIAYQRRSGARWEIHRIDPDGGGMAQVTSADVVGFAGHPTWSNDSGSLAFQSNAQADVFRVPATGGDITNLTNDPAVAKEPAWSPDGARIAFISTRGGAEDLWVIELR